MATDDELSRPFAYTLGALGLVVLGLLLVVAGFRYGQTWYLAGGIVFVVVGLFILARTFVLRNRGRRR
ncbi:hypothetical protein [Mesorhizobium xinjiangense]|uniref:hypothetical protein n=1 Tax=Mesorhizobium xinjiangense TaxID=2678685 RepID=UPI0012EE7E09|nr:hypothetical protein [Mesorhizobium xinjiangense]